MTSWTEEEAVFVEAPARLHFGVLDLRGSRGRWFGGIGAAAPAPTLLVSARKAAALEVEGDDRDRALVFTEQALAHHRVDRRVRVVVHRSLPAHVGLGSGTQLALAVSRAIGELFDRDGDVAGLAPASGRARRSAIGTYAFSGGGLIVEGGRRPDSSGPAPLLARMPIPPTWWCVVAVPHAGRGLSGEAEAAAFAGLPAPSEREVERVAHLVLMGLLPALADADLTAFGEALCAIQAITGRWFAPAQGGTFAPGPTEALVRTMARWGALGVGQSSWGPAAYGLIEGEDAGRHLAARVRGALASSGSVYDGPFPDEGARVWRGTTPDLRVFDRV